MGSPGELNIGRNISGTIFIGNKLSMRKASKFILLIIGSILFLVLGAVLYLNTPWGQNFVRGKAEAFLKNKLKTEVRIGYLGYGLPKYIVMNDVLFLDQVRDTLLSVKLLKVDLDMFKLLDKKIDVQQIVLSGLHSHIYRNSPDTNFNFSYILTAFTDNSAKTQKTQDTTASLSFTLDRVKLDDIHLRLNDYTGGMQFAINLDHLDLKMKKLDINSLLFHLKDLSVEGLTTTYSQDTSYLPPNPHPSKNTLKLIADNVSLKDIAVQYNDNLNKFLFGLKLGELQLQLNQFGMEHDVIDVKKLKTRNTDIVLTMGSLTTAPAFVDSLIKIDTTVGWHINAGDIDMANVNFKMDDQSQQRLKLGLDYSHLYLQHTALQMNDFLYTSDTIAGNVKHFSGTEQCGLDVKELRTKFNNNPQGATLSNLYFQTPTSTIQDHLEVHYPSVAAVTKRTQLLQLKIHVVNSIVGLHDLLMFAPQLNDQEIFHKFKNGQMKVEATINGLLNNMDIAHFYVAGMDNTEILLNGRLGGMPEPKDLSYNLNITKFQSSRKDVSMLVPDTLLSSVRLPDRFGITGQVSGNAADYNANLYLASTDGVAYIKGLLTTSAGKGNEHYDMVLKTSQLNIGRILKQDSLMGQVTANIQIKGQSFDVKKMTASADGNISSAFVKGYGYHDITLYGKVAGKAGDLHLQSADSNLRLQLTAHGDFNGKYAAVKADIRMDSIDFHALKLYSTELRARGTIHADFPELNPDYPRGEFKWWSPVIVADGKRYFMDSIYVTSHPSADTGQNIFADLNVMQATITGKTPLTKIGAIIQDHINRHSTLPVKDSIKNSLATTGKSNTDYRIKINKKPTVAKNKTTADTTAIPVDYNLNLTAHILDKPLLRSILPGLTSFDSIHVDGSLTPRQLVLNATVPQLVYSTYTIRNANVQVRGSDSALTYKITMDQIGQGRYALYYADIHGNLAPDKITTNISLSDAARKERFAIIADMQTVGDSQVIHLLPGLKLNYETWDVAQPNRVVLNSKGFYVQTLDISNKGQFIKANSVQSAANTPLKIDIGNFVLANFTDIISKGDTLPANGVLSGNITLEQMTPLMKVSGDLQVQNLTVFGDTLGNLQVQVNNKTDNALDTKITLKGSGNDITVAGVYNLSANNSDALNFNVDVSALSVHSFEGMAMHQVKNSSGFLRGNLNIKGTFSSPQITGELHTDNLVTTVSTLNAEFKMPAEKISFTPNKISFDNFNIVDNKNNKATVSGSLGIEDLTDPDLNLDIKANNWMALHSTVKDNKEFYGDLLLTTNLKVTGSASTPSIDGNIYILKGTKLTVVNPQQDPELQSTTGIIAFVNMRDTTYGKYLMPKPKDTTAHLHKLAAGSDVNVNITVDKAAEFSLIIDQASGDFISVSGDAYLNTAVTPGGEMTLAGSYQLHSGAYQMNYNFIKRKFLIQDGSTVTFAGDPVKGTTLDISAIYEAKIPPYDLIVRQVTDPTQLNYFKQSLPFNVDLNLKGNVMQPAITFDVVLPENKVYPLTPDQIQLIEGKLSQLRTDTTELNKQVFAVLILSRFVSDDPFNSGASTGLQYTAIQSVSTFIGEQLNQAAGKLIKGVDLSVDLATTDDYTTGDMRQRTDLNLAASKRLLNDRLKLTVGNDFELEGPQTTNQQQSSLVPSNLSADYLLSADGRYTFQVYRKNYDEGVLEGFVTETGVNFIVSVDYNQFKTVFQRSKPKKQSLNVPAK